jgi:hypothetical protein
MEHRSSQAVTGFWRKVSGARRGVVFGFLTAFFLPPASPDPVASDRLPLLSQSGTVAIEGDFPISPDAVGEISLLMSNYDPQYGPTYSAVEVASTKAGTDHFHGGGYEFNRITDFNARFGAQPALQ